jgi:hypothetical protein
VIVVPQPNKWGENKEKWIFTDYYEITIDTVDGEPVDGSFEGNGKVMIDGATAVVLAPWIQSRSNALFHGTGTFDGQTLNFVTHWREPAGGIVWDGYLLKP